VELVGQVRVVQCRVCCTLRGAGVPPKSFDRMCER
jgi:hypothetical protein